MSAISISTVLLLGLGTVAVLVDGPPRMLCVIAAVVGTVAVGTWWRWRRALRARRDWDRFETEFRDYVQRLERAP